jgi:hypothetical protein
MLYDGASYKYMSIYYLCHVIKWYIISKSKTAKVLKMFTLWESMINVRVQWRRAFGLGK